MPEAGISDSLTPKLREAYEAELLFDCRIAIDAWNHLRERTHENLPSSSNQDAVTHLFRIWGELAHVMDAAGRISRILFPPIQSSEAARYAPRLRELLEVPPDSILGLRGVRNRLEHVEDYLPEYVRMSQGRAMSRWTVGPEDATRTRRRNVAVFAHIVTHGWKCVVYGVDCEVERLMNAVMDLNVRLSDPPVTVFLTNAESPWYGKLEGTSP